MQDMSEMSVFNSGQENWPCRLSPALPAQPEPIQLIDQSINDRLRMPCLGGGHPSLSHPVRSNSGAGHYTRAARPCR